MRPFIVTIPAGGNDRFDCAGSRLLLCDASSLASFNVRVDQGEDIPFKEGRKYIHSGGNFKLVEVFNTDPVNPLTVSLLAGAGDVSDNSVYVQSIQQIVQTVNVEDAPLLAETTLVKNAAQGIQTLLQDDTAQRAALTTLEGATYWEKKGAGGTETIVSSGANTNGIVVRLAQIYSAENSTNESSFKAGGNPFLLMASRDVPFQCVQAKDIFIPAGVAFTATLVGTTYNHMFAWYEVL